VLPIYDQERCKEVFAASRAVIGPDQICAGGEAGKDSCSGDSGSALTIEAFPLPYDPRVIQVGVVSYGSRRCGTPKTPAVYSRVSSYLDWILDSTTLT